MVSILLVIVLSFTYLILIDHYHPKMIGNYIIYIEYADGYGTTHQCMLIDIYISLIFLLWASAYLGVQVKKTFAILKSSIEKPESLNTELVSSKHSYLLALGFGVFFAFGFELLASWALEGSLEIVSINIPIVTYFFFMYFSIAFLVGKGVWTVLTSIYLIKKAAKQNFKMNVKDPWPWINDENIGGFKQLSVLSLNIFKIIPIGVLLFSPAVILYYSRLYAVYFFTAILVGLFLFIYSQQVVHKEILTNKEKFHDLARNKLENREISQLEYLDLLRLIDSIEDRPINISALWGVFISSIALPVLYWFILMVLREILQIIPP